MSIVAFPNFVSQSYKTINGQYDGSRVVNWYPELNENRTGANDEIKQFIMTPGLTKAIVAHLAGKSIRAIYTTSTGKGFVVAGNKCYKINNSSLPLSISEIGTLFTTKGFVNFADNGDLLCIVDGYYGYSYGLVSNAFNQITDESFLGSNFVYFYDGYFVFAQPGTNKFYWSILNTLSFDPLDYDYKSGNSDPISGFGVANRNLWLIGTQTTEIWYNVGGDVTFQRIPGPYLETGCIAPQTIQKTEQGLLWVAGNLRGGAYVVATAGQSYSVNRVSTYPVELVLQSYGTILAKSSAYAYQQNGHLFYIINPPNGSSSWCLDITMTLAIGPTWHERTYTNDKGIQTRHLADNHCFYKGYHLVGSYTSSTVYYFDQNNRTDDGATITRDRIAPNLVNNMKRVFYNMFQPFCQTGRGRLPPCISTPPVITEYVLNEDNPSIDLTWTEGSFTRADVASYQIWRADVVYDPPVTPPNFDDYYLFSIVEPEVLTFSDDEIDSGYDYFYFIRAISTSPSDCGSVDSNIVDVVFSEPPVQGVLIRSGAGLLIRRSQGNVGVAQTLNGNFAGNDFSENGAKALVTRTNSFTGYPSTFTVRVSGTDINDDPITEDIVMPSDVIYFVGSTTFYSFTNVTLISTEVGTDQFYSVGFEWQQVIGNTGFNDVTFYQAVINRTSASNGSDLASISGCFSDTSDLYVGLQGFLPAGDSIAFVQRSANAGARTLTINTSGGSDSITMGSGVNTPVYGTLPLSGTIVSVHCDNVSGGAVFVDIGVTYTEAV